MAKARAKKEVPQEKLDELKKLKAPRSEISKSIDTYTEDLSFDYKDIDAPAMFIPSMSRNYVSYTSSYHRIPEDRAPQGLHADGRELNFLDENSSTFYYPFALTSAGHANLDFERDNVNDGEGMIRKRDKSKTVIIGDSGGYQIGKGILEFDWKNFESEKNDQLKMKILRWLESIADISMTIDVPPWGIGEPRCGITDFNDCLVKTLINHDFIIKNRVPGATRFMNILQGRNEEEGDIWWDAMKDLPFEGWALAGVHMSDFELILRRLIIMRDGGYLDESRNWMHFLGVSRMSSACAFSAIQRNIRKHVEPTFTISFDASSPFFSTAKGRMYSRLAYSAKGLSYTMDSAIDTKDLAGSSLPFPLLSPIGRKLKLGDTCIKGHDVESKSSWDSWSYMFLMNHNTYMHTKGIKEVNQFFQLPRPQVNDFIPPHLLQFKDLCEDVFTSETPMKLIKGESKLLKNISGMNMENRKLSSFESLSEFFSFDDCNPDLGVENYDDHGFDETKLDEIIASEQK